MKDADDLWRLRKGSPRSGVGRLPAEVKARPRAHPPSLLGIVIAKHPQAVRRPRALSSVPLFHLLLPTAARPFSSRRSTTLEMYLAFLLNGELPPLRMTQSSGTGSFGQVNWGVPGFRNLVASCRQR